MKASERERIQRLITVARLYWEERLTQAEIAAAIGYSRSMVSRLLTAAEDEGIVTVQITHPMARVFSLEEQLKEMFSLEDALIAPSEATVDSTEVLRMAGRFLADSTERDDVLAVTNGRTVAAVVSACPQRPKPEVTVVQAIGTIARGTTTTDAPDISSRLAAKFHCGYRLLPAPLVVKDCRLAQAWKHEPAISMTLAMAAHADVLLTGIGAADAGGSTIFDFDLPERDREVLRRRGGVGHVGGHHISQDGSHVDGEFCQRILAVPFERLVDIRRVIGVAWGQEKASAILGALRSGVLSCLVSDLPTVQQVLHLAREGEGRIN